MTTDPTTPSKASVLTEAAIGAWRTKATSVYHAHKHSQCYVVSLDDVNEVVAMLREALARVDALQASRETVLSERDSFISKLSNCEHELKGARTALAAMTADRDELQRKCAEYDGELQHAGKASREMARQLKDARTALAAATEAGVRVREAAQKAHDALQCILVQVGQTKLNQADKEMAERAVDALADAASEPAAPERCDKCGADSEKAAENWCKGEPCPAKESWREKEAAPHRDERSQLERLYERIRMRPFALLPGWGYDPTRHGDLPSEFERGHSHGTQVAMNEIDRMRGGEGVGPDARNCWPSITVNILTAERLAQWGITPRNPWRDSDLRNVIEACQKVTGKAWDPPKPGDIGYHDDKDIVAVMFSLGDKLRNLASRMQSEKHGSS